jgi:hypothetical protein
MIQAGDRVLAVTRTETEEGVRDALVTMNSVSGQRENGNTAILEGKGIEISVAAEDPEGSSEEDG